MLKEFKENFKNKWKPFQDDALKNIKELKDPKTRKKQIPNLLTASRLLSPLFILPAALSGNLPLAVLFTAIFASTDALDGFVAKKFNLQSEFGRELDPISDKVFAITLLIPLLVSYPIIITNIISELVISGINVHSRLKGNKPKSSILGKTKTCILYETILLGYLSTITAAITPLLINKFVFITLIAQLVCSQDYAKKYVKAEIEKAKEKEETTPTKIEEVVKEEKEKVKEKEPTSKDYINLKEQINNKDNNIVVEEKNKEITLNKNN